MWVDALPDFDRHGSKLISTDLRVLPHADLGRISSGFCWGCGWAPRALCSSPHSSLSTDQQAGSSHWVLFRLSAVSCRPGSHDRSLAIKPNAARWRREPLEIGGEMGQVWISTPLLLMKSGSYLQHKLGSYCRKLSFLSHYKRLHRSYGR